MKYEKLGQHILQVRGISYNPENVRTEQLDGYVPIIKSNNIREEGFDSKGLIYISHRYIRPEQFIQKGDIVLTASSGSKKTIGKNIQFDNDYNGSFGAFCKLIRPRSSINHQFLYHFFKTRFFRRSIEQAVQGANISNLKNEYIDDLKIPYPSIADQVCIADVLTRAEKLIAKRKESIRALDEFLKSTFLEMFGDPVRNEKGWAKESFAKIVALECPLTYGIVQPGQEYANGIVIVRPVDLSSRIIHIHNHNLKRIDPAIAKKFERTRLNGGELLLCVRGTTGQVSIAGMDLRGANVTRGITPIWFDNTFNNLFALEQIKSRSIQKKIEEKTYGIALKQINLKELRALELITPPLQLQNQFAVIIEKVEALKTKYTESLTELENLYASLSQRAFKGELDLSRVPVEETGRDATF